MLRVMHMQNDYGNELNIAIMDKNGNRRAVARPLVFDDITDSYVKEPTIKINFYQRDKSELATFFLDWLKIAEDLNIKLNQDFSKEREAMKFHLEDMRKLVFKTRENE